MPFSVFNTLVARMQSSLERNELQGSHVGGAISVQSQIAMSLAFLGGGRCWDIMDVHGVAKSTFHRVVERVLDAIIHSDNVGNIQWPHITDLRAHADGFCALSDFGLLPHCIGAVDGLFIRTVAPSKSETLNVKRFYSGHKQGYGMNLQAVSDSRLRFIGASMTTPGSTNDLMAWNCSTVKHDVSVLPDPFHIVGDCAYINSKKLLTPFIGSNLPQHKDAFNFFLSQLRITVERAFGVFVGRWAILWKCQRANLKMVAKIVHACIKLHNFCIDEGAPFTPDELLLGQQCRPAMDDLGVLMPARQWTTMFAQAPANDSDPFASPNSNLVDLRDSITQMILDEGYERPDHNLARRAHSNE